MHAEQTTTKGPEGLAGGTPAPPTSPDFAREVAAATNFLAVERLDRALQRDSIDPSKGVPRIRLALLGSSTQAHLHPAIRVGGLRHNLAISIHQGEYGRYLQDLLGPDEALAAFAPDIVLMALDAPHLAGGLRPDMPAAEVEARLDATLARLAQCWEAARGLGAQVIQQTALPTLDPLLGQNEHLLPGSPATFIARLNTRLREAAAAAKVPLLAIDTEAAREGLATFHDKVLWHRAKQEISPAAAPRYGELVARLIAAARGKAAKCLILDLDNTLWGGVVGDDGLEGLALGQGSAEGEAFVAIQAYVRALSQRGIALAVCSKNDEANARAPFEKHPDMVLRLDNIACFVANWQDKASNIRHIAETLSLGLDAMVFLDDNPAERALVARELPMVRVVDMPEEPAAVPAAIAATGWFEAISVTAEDLTRSAQYRGNAAREALKASVTDIDSYLASLDMRLLWRRFDRLGLARIAQLINKTNQFNLTTLRYTEEQVTAMIDADDVRGLQFRLTDTFGDNGMIAVVILRRTDDRARVAIDTWLMSCRVLGRGVESAMLERVAAEARAMGAATLTGDYVPTARNGMVREHYPKLGFALAGTPAEDGAGRYELTLAETKIAPHHIRIEEGQA